MNNNLLEREIMEKFHRLDKAGRKRVSALIEREIAEYDNQDESHPSEETISWVDFINATYGSLADDPLDEVDNTRLPPPVRDEVE